MFEALEHRVVIEWGRAAQAWHQYTMNKITARNRVYDHLVVW